jgi:hypothetical protein
LVPSVAIAAVEASMAGRNPAIAAIAGLATELFSAAMERVVEAVRTTVH